AGAHGQVVVQRHPGELALLGLDPAPLQREPVAPEAEVGQQAEILRPAGPVVAGVPARLRAPRPTGVLPGPPVVVPVAPLDLVGGGGRAPHETVGEGAPGWCHARNVSVPPGRRPAADSTIGTPHRTT